jgi:hypothetical protein
MFHVAANISILPFYSALVMPQFSLTVLRKLISLHIYFRHLIHKIRTHEVLSRVHIENNFYEAFPINLVFCWNIVLVLQKTQAEFFQNLGISEMSQQRPFPGNVKHQSLTTMYAQNSQGTFGGRVFYSVKKISDIQKACEQTKESLMSEPET